MARAFATAWAARWALLGALALLVSAGWMWGFTVDDALISVRYARHVAAGLGWRFDAGGPSTDGVTPLPWPVVLAPFARVVGSREAWHVLTCAKALGLAAHVVTGALVGFAAGRAVSAPVWARVAVLAVLALSIRVAAHAVSGMETSLAMLLATGAATALRRPLLASALAGAAAAFRPEMAVWATTVAGGAAFTRRESPARVVTGLGLSLGPFATCAIVRLAVWGRAAPLALMAKPSDVTFGLPYTGAALVVSVVPVLLLSPAGLRRAPDALVLFAGGVAHAAALVAVGGDWMPYARLWAPVVPSLAIAALAVSARAAPMSTALRASLALALGAWLVGRGGTAGRSVGADRRALVAEGRAALAPYHRIAAVDIGWVGAASDADVVDLAGVTDPEVAALPGGHTSKRVGSMYLLGRDADALLLYAARGLPAGGLQAWRDAAYSRAVEARLARDDVIARHFAPVSWLPLGAGGAGYVLLAKMPAPGAPD
ncbi:MAG: hypothetical protein FWD17_15905 [Polyangiaceae bacterium]|nr:hypothetical protein [Polyangiaceae bacterium]